MTVDRNSPEMKNLLADLNATFGRGKAKTDNELARERNLKWHESNIPLAKGGVAARPDPEDSQAWKPLAFITHIFRQTCQSCNNTVEYTGAEHIKFRCTAHGLLNSTVTKAVRDCNLFHFPIEQLPDLVEEHVETVSRCPGCIAVERQATELFARISQPSMQLDLDLTQPGGITSLRNFDEYRRGDDIEWPTAFRQPSKEAL